tara:strand:+ start:1052 stop:1249 length:198 start_codon:yes stop_codon:yes gene_type:complete
MYWLALVLGIIVLGASFFVGKKKGLLNSRKDDISSLPDNRTIKDKIFQDEDEEQRNDFDDKTYQS